MTKFIEIPANKKSLSLRRAKYGVGINDSLYLTNPTISGKKIMCQYYSTWSEMLKRCYSDRYQSLKPTYKGCSVCGEWLIFSAFKKWMKTQDWKGKHLDKDILIPDNKIYSPESCIFISVTLNNLLGSNDASRGEYPQGVSFYRPNGKYVAQCRSGRKNRNLGFFTSIRDAEYTYLKYKSGVVLSFTNSEEVLGNKLLSDSLIKISNAMLDKAEKLMEIK